MRPAARIQAAIDVLDEMQARHRPASQALADWGKSHRFAGSGDRAAIGNLVYDALRHRASADHLMQAETARARILGSLRIVAGMSPDAIAALCDGAQFAPKALSAEEAQHLAGALDAKKPDYASAEMLPWAFKVFQSVFGDDAIHQGRALAERAPVDIRVNTLKSDRAKVAIALARHKPAATLRSALGLRIPLPEGAARHPNVEAELCHGQGWFEVQDEGSQIAAALTGVKPGDTVLDLCAGAGGKTLALAAALNNRGRLCAYDDDMLRLRPIVERLNRAGATCVEPVTAGDTAALAALGDVFDCVLVDAPCSGSGTWRRKPDAKWRLKPHALEKRHQEQRAVLETAARHVRPGGRLVYVTCSLFPSENVQQVDAFLGVYPDFALVPTANAWANASPGTLTGEAPASADGRTDTLLLSPASHTTDGFFAAVMTRKK
jgi:16S rRNA (cytosine967-C5)-methyltransferase